MTYIPKISNVLVLDDIEQKRVDAEKLGQAPREAWLLECVQADRANPRPCSEEDKKKYPNGMVGPRPANTTQEIKPITAPDAGVDEDDDMAAIMGKKPDASIGAHEGGASEDEDEMALIMGKKPDASAATAPPPPKEESDEDDLKAIMGKKDGG